MINKNVSNSESGHYLTISGYNFCSQIRNLVSSQTSNTCCVCRYTTCVSGYSTLSVDKEHLFVCTLEVAVGTQLKQLRLRICVPRCTSYCHIRERGRLPATGNIMKTAN